MTSEEFATYVRPAARNLCTPALPHLQSVQLKKALGWPRYIAAGAPSVDFFPLTEERKTLLIQLAGPYGHIILKAYQIKHGLENTT